MQFPGFGKIHNLTVEEQLENLLKLELPEDAEGIKKNLPDDWKERWPESFGEAAREWFR